MWFPSLPAVTCSVSGSPEEYTFSLFETSYSWVETLVSKVALLGLPIVVSVVAMTAPTSAAMTAPTMISTLASACGAKLHARARHVAHS